MSHFIFGSWRTPLAALGLLFAVATASAQKGTAGQTQKRFATAEEAVQSVIKAAKANNQAELLAIFGADAEDLLSSGDKIADKRARQVILVALKEKWKLARQGTNTKTLVIGNEEWPYPDPASQGFKAVGVSIRRPGGKKSYTGGLAVMSCSTIQACRVYLKAQREYAAQSHDGKPAGLFAQKLASEPGKQDGLYWKVNPGEGFSPLGEFAAQASAEGYARSDSGPTPFHGYLFRPLTAQGPAAPGGAKSYISNGEMKGGFALIAYPAEYRKSGVMTFMINQDGVIFEKDLGENCPGCQPDHRVQSRQIVAKGPVEGRLFLSEEPYPANPLCCYHPSLHTCSDLQFSSAGSLWQKRL